jgi:hypothetical protein
LSLSLRHASRSRAGIDLQRSPPLRLFVSLQCDDYDLQSRCQLTSHSLVWIFNDRVQAESCLGSRGFRGTSNQKLPWS